MGPQPRQCPPGWPDAAAGAAGAGALAGANFATRNPPLAASTIPSRKGSGNLEPCGGCSTRATQGFTTRAPAHTNGITPARPLGPNPPPPLAPRGAAGP